MIFKQKKKIDIAKPWLDNEEFKTKIKARNRLYTLSKKNPEVAHLHKDRLKQLSLEINCMRRHLKRAHFGDDRKKAGTNAESASDDVNKYVGIASLSAIFVSSSFIYRDYLTPVMT